MLQDPVAGSMDRRQKTHPEQALKCPRCDSTNTKFCYYNNYNLAQPRHFCKTCRRYWTKGGSLRNVPIGGGCRKNKKLRQRTLDPSSIFQGLHDPTSNMLATIDRESCSSLLGSLSAPSTSTYVDLSNQGHGFSLTLSRLQEALRLRDQFGTVQRNHPVFEPHLNGSSEVAQELLSPSSCRLTPFTANLTSLRFPSSINVKEEHSLQYSSADLCPLFEANRHIASPKVATLEEQFSTYSAPNEHVRHQQKGLRLQLVHDAQNGGQAGQEILPGFEEDTKEYLKHIKGCQKGRFYESYYDNEDGYNFWINNNIEWPEFHALG